MSEAIASTEERLAAYNANVAAAEKDPRLSPETGKPLDKVTMFRFGAGFIVFGLLWMSGLGIVSAVLLPMHYKTIPGVNPDALVGVVNAFTAVASLVANLMFGNFSDRSRSRFGRRTPWILFGAVLGGVMLFLTGTTHNAVLLTIFYCGCMFGLNCMIAPLVASCPTACRPASAEPCPPSTAPAPPSALQSAPCWAPCSSKTWFRASPSPACSCSSAVSSP